MKHEVSKCLYIMAQKSLDTTDSMLIEVFGHSTVEPTCPDAGCSDRLGPSFKHFRTVNVLHFLMA